MKGKAKSTREQKRAWLKSHPEFWERSPSEIKKLMAAAGLCSPLTNPSDMGLRRMVNEILKSGAYQVPGAGS